MWNNIPKLKHIDSGNFLLIAGPCVIESEKITLDIASFLCNLSDKFKIPFIFKSSYRKANRTEWSSFQGIGDAEALIILKAVGSNFNIPVLTDFHSCTETRNVAQFVDILQIPAFLCRQTDLLEAAAETKLWINIKKGQFASYIDMFHAMNKILKVRDSKIMITERGNTFGYDDLVIDFRNIVLLKAMGCPVIVDVTHSLGNHAGHIKMITAMAKAALAVGADGIFVETHPNPADALSDSKRMLPLNMMEELVQKLIPIRNAIR